VITAYIGLGSNLDDPLNQIEQAALELAALPGCQLLALSPRYRSAPMGPADQPDYINAVAALATQLEPLALLDALQAIEQQHGRQRLLRWGARTLDLDLLLYGEQTIDHPRLMVPHPGMLERAFVLVPLADIAAQLVLADGQNVATLASPQLRAQLQLVASGPLT
jgi:2-amino-4-hydroxy-6-hydroxymethyldihydropteridine diphosphokinase